MGKCEKLKWNRRKLGMSQEELAGKIGVSQATICRLERDETAWSVMRDQTADATFDILNKLGSWQCNLDTVFDNPEADGVSIDIRGKMLEKRKALGITQADLSYTLGISIPTISRYENKPEVWENPSPDIYSKLLAFINGEYDDKFIQPATIAEDTPKFVSIVEAAKNLPTIAVETETNTEEESKEVLCELIDILNKKISQTEDSKVYANMIIGLCNGYLKEA